MLSHSLQKIVMPLELCLFSISFLKFYLNCVLWYIHSVVFRNRIKHICFVFNCKSCLAHDNFKRKLMQKHSSKEVYCNEPRVASTPCNGASKVWFVCCMKLEVNINLSHSEVAKLFPFSIFKSTKTLQRSCFFCSMSKIGMKCILLIFKTN